MRGRYPTLNGVSQIVVCSHCLYQTISVFVIWNKVSQWQSGLLHGISNVRIPTSRTRRPDSCGNGRHKGASIGGSRRNLNAFDGSSRHINSTAGCRQFHSTIELRKGGPPFGRSDTGHGNHRIMRSWIGKSIVTSIARRCY